MITYVSRNTANALYGDVRLWANSIPTPWLNTAPNAQGLYAVDLDSLKADILTRRASNLKAGFADRASVYDALLPYANSGNVALLPSSNAVQDFLFARSGTHPEYALGFKPGTMPAGYDYSSHGLPEPTAAPGTAQSPPALAVAGIAAALAAWWWLK